MMTTLDAVQYMQTLLIRSRYRAPNALIEKQINMTAQNMRIVCQGVATKSSFHKEMALRMSWPPEKLMLLS